MNDKDPYEEIKQLIHNRTMTKSQYKRLRQGTRWLRWLCSDNYRPNMSLESMGLCKGE